MKIRIDQNLSYRVARAVVAALPNRDGFEVTHVGDVHAPGTSDPDWLTEFASEGGTAMKRPANSKPKSTKKPAK